MMGHRMRAGVMWVTVLLPVVAFSLSPIHSASTSQHATLKLRPRSSQFAEELEELDADVASVMRGGRDLEEESPGHVDRDVRGKLTSVHSPIVHSLYKGFLNIVGARGRHEGKIEEMDEAVRNNAAGTLQALQRLETSVQDDSNNRLLHLCDTNQEGKTYHAFKSYVDNCINLLRSVNAFQEETYDEFEVFLENHYIYNPYRDAGFDDSYCFYEQDYVYAGVLPYQNTHFIGGHYRYHTKNEGKSVYYDTIYEVRNFCMGTATNFEKGMKFAWPKPEKKFQEAWARYKQNFELE